MDTMTDAAMAPGLDSRTSKVLAPWSVAWGPWLQLTQTAFHAWMGLWTAMLPQRQAEVVLQAQRQTLEAWTTSLAWAAPPPEPQIPAAWHPPSPPLPRPIPAASPQPVAVAAATARPEPEMPRQARQETAAAETREPEKTTDSAGPVGAAPSRQAPPRSRKAAKPAAELRQPGPRKAQRQARHPRPTTRR